MIYVPRHINGVALRRLMRFLVSVMLLSAVWLNSVNAGPVDTFQFKDEATKLRFQLLSKELRCPKCQNQNLADSNSKIAVDLRKNLYNLLQEGNRPQLKKQTLILWFAPLIILLGFIISLVFVLRKRSKVKASELNLSSHEQTNLDDILNKK